MAISVQVDLTRKPYETQYRTSMLRHGVFFVVLRGGVTTGPHPSVGGLYPVVIDPYDDRSILDLEMFVRDLPWHEDRDLVPPTRHAITGQVLIGENAGDADRVWCRTDARRGVLCVAAESDVVGPVRHIQIADRTIIDVSAEHTLCGLWLVDLPRELAHYLDREGLVRPGRSPFEN